jgi:hypothetical protein
MWLPAKMVEAYEKKIADLEALLASRTETRP